MDSLMEMEKRKRAVQEFTSVKNDLYPVFIKLDHLNILVVGAGNVALEKLHSILSNSPAARVRIVSPLVKNELRKFILDYPHSHLIEREFLPEDLDGRDLIFLATDDR